MESAGLFFNILVIRGGAIGDFILTLPVLSALRHCFPQARIEIAGYPSIACLALPSFADKVSPVESPALAGFFSPNGDLDSGWSAYFARFDLILSYIYDPQGIFAQNIKRCSKARFISGPHRPAEDGGVHATRALLQPLEQLGVTNPDPVPRLDVGYLEPFPKTHRSSHIIAVHPGSGSDKKNWPEEKWAMLLQKLSAKNNVHLQIIGGEAEGGKLIRLAQTLAVDRFTLLQNLPLDRLAKELSRVNFFIGHDSGITHLAAAIGLPGLVLWGPSALEVWRPVSDQMKILNATDHLKELTVETVMSALPNDSGNTQ